MKKITFKYFKNRILLMLSFMVISFALFFSSNEIAKAGEGYQNAYLCCFIDDTNNTYRTQVIYSGATVEYANVSHLFPYLSLNTKYDANNGGHLYNGRVPLYNMSWSRNTTTGNQSVSYGGTEYNTNLSINDSTGYFEYGEFSKVSGGNNNTFIPDGDFYIYAENFVSNDSLGHADCSPCTFPYPNRDAKASDINRAYEVQDAISDDFMNALLFINNGENFETVDELVKTAYYVCTSNDDVVIQNGDGNSFRLVYTNPVDPNNASVLDKNPYTYNLVITRLQNNNNNSDTSSASTQRFTYAVKKGYKLCNNDDVMENGAKNNLVRSDCENDTIFITWENLYVNAGVLYENGVTYANQGDIFKLSDMESKVVDITRNLLGGLRSMLQLYTIEDCIFNSGVRGSGAFVYGIYNESWGYNINLIMLVFSSIALSLVAFSIVKLVIQKEISIISPATRLSLIEGIKDILISVMFIAFAYLMFRVLFLMNFKFVNIFTEWINGKTLTDYAGYSTLASVIYQFAYFIITIYVNFVYILRGFAVPFFMMISPICLYAFSLGKGGQRITATWFKEFVGYVFIQSIHALVYGFCVASSGGLRGIESIILCASIIPLTSAVRNVFGLGGGLLDTASNLTTATALAGTGVASAGLNMAGNVVGGAVEKIGGAVGGPIASNIGKTVGSVSKMAGSGFGNTIGGFSGAGISVALGGENSSASTQGASLVSHSANDLGKSVSKGMEDVSGLTIDGLGASGKFLASGLDGRNDYFSQTAISRGNSFIGRGVMGRGGGLSGSPTDISKAIGNEQLRQRNVLANSSNLKIKSDIDKANSFAVRFKMGDYGSFSALSRNAEGGLEGTFTPISMSEYQKKFAPNLDINNANDKAYLQKSYSQHLSTLNEMSTTNNPIIKDALRNKGVDIDKVHIKTSDNEAKTTYNLGLDNKYVSMSEFGNYKGVNNTNGLQGRELKAFRKEYAKGYKDWNDRIDNSSNA